MELRSRETTPTEEDLDFIVDEGYNHDEDPDYVPNEKYDVTGSEIKKELIKVLERLYSIEATIENKLEPRKSLLTIDKISSDSDSDSDSEEITDQEIEDLISSDDE